MREAVIVSSVRTPIGRAFKGTLRATRPDELAAVAIKGALHRVPQLDTKEIEDVIIGCFPLAALIRLATLSGEIFKTLLRGESEAFDQLCDSIRLVRFEFAQEEATIHFTAILSEPAVRVAVHRLRHRYRQVLRDEIAQTVASAEGVEDELRSLMAALA